VSSTLGSIGDKAKYMKDDDARKAMPFAAKIPAYKMSKVGSALHPSCRCVHRISSGPVFGPAYLHPLTLGFIQHCLLALCVALSNVWRHASHLQFLVASVTALFFAHCSKVQPSRGENMCILQAALNMLTMSLAADLKDDGITVICYCPGW